MRTGKHDESARSALAQAIKSGPIAEALAVEMLAGGFVTKKRAILLIEEEVSKGRLERAAGGMVGAKGCACKHAPVVATPTEPNPKGRPHVSHEMAVETAVYALRQGKTIVLNKGTFQEMLIGTSGRYHPEQYVVQVRAGRNYFETPEAAAGYALREGRVPTWYLKERAIVAESEPSVSSRSNPTSYANPNPRPPSIAREGTRVIFQPNPASLMLYRDPPQIGEHGTVTSVPLGARRSTFMPGPGGGLVYVRWDDGGFQGVAPQDLVRERRESSRSRRGGFRPEKYGYGLPLSKEDVEAELKENPTRDAFTSAYIEAALFTSTDEDDRPMDERYSSADIAPETLARMTADAARFQKENADDLAASDSEQGGHDFWLTRNRHGAGFWDGDWPEPQATRLTDAAHRYGSFDLYVGDDGQIHGSGGRENPKSKTNPVPGSLPSALNHAVQQSAAELRARVSNVRLGPIEGNVETIYFDFDGEPYQGRLVGRNRDVVVGSGPEQDAAIAVRVLLDRQATKLASRPNPVPGSWQARHEHALERLLSGPGSGDLGADYMKIREAGLSHELAVGALARRYKMPAAKVVEAVREHEVACRAMTFKPNPTKPSVEIDEIAKDELEGYLENTGELYAQKLSIVKNLQKKIAAGKYDPKKAPILWGYWVEAGAKRYAKEYASGSSWHVLFPKPLRDQLSREIAEHEYGRITRGEYDSGSRIKNPVAEDEIDKAARMIVHGKSVEETEKDLIAEGVDPEDAFLASRAAEILVRMDTELGTE